MTAEQRRQENSDPFGADGHTAQRGGAGAPVFRQPPDRRGGRGLCCAHRDARSLRRRGYVIPAPAGLVRQVACRHTAAQTREELDAMVDCGCTVIDVVVEHPVYGQLTAPLQIASRYDVEQYLLRMENLGGQPLSMLTDGIHLHTSLRAPARRRFPSCSRGCGSWACSWTELPIDKRETICITEYTCVMTHVYSIIFMR